MAERKKSSQIRQDQKPLIFVSTSLLTAMAELMFLGGRLCTTLSLHNFEIVMFPNFLRSKVCSRFAAHKVPRIQSLLYQLDTKSRFTCVASNVSGHILTIWGMSALFGGYVLRKKKETLLCLHPLKQIPLLIISKKIFFKTQSSRLGAIVAPNRGYAQNTPCLC